ncbi:hypothetical protein [Christiangramia crocea]|uniref:Uncharacterized protein n=1 Tax=Christiangramia crocea TaxID=2904124 RepID=A0A9X2A8B0_9FLAO|nr:hypothetical protein [Gramella crocea]MCG9972212.1 hypothetical protein [Gramella crocea]
MGFKTIISQRSFWKSVLWLGLSFLVLYNVITILFEYGELAFSTFFRERTADGKLFRFIIGQILASFLYGFILAYAQFRSKEKKK